MEVLSFLAAPFVMCLILVGIHCYLGIHVLKRGVIFVDLSLAQVASLGSTVALLFHFEHHSSGSYFFSLGFTFFVSLYFAFMKRFENIVSQEVVIALVYAFAGSAVILVVNSMAHGAEHIKEILIGKILWVSWEEVIKTALIYSFVGATHYFLRKQMFNVTRGIEQKNSVFWDFVFYALFGVVITSSVGVAGILLVFSFLVVPALFSINLNDTTKKQLLYGWLIGGLLSFVGMYLSYQMDLPAGAVLVIVFTMSALIIFPFLTKVTKKNSNDVSVHRG